MVEMKFLDDPLMTPKEVADVFRVDPKTVSRWAAAEVIPSTRTPGGHYRFRTSEITKLFNESQIEEGEPQCDTESLTTSDSSAESSPSPSASVSSG